MKANLNFEESPEQRKATASEEWKAVQVQCLCQCLGRGLSIMPDSESGWPLPFKVPPKRRGHGASVNIFFSVHSGSHCYKITSGWHDAMIMMTRDDVHWQVQDTTVTLLGREVLPMGISGWNTTQCARRREVMVNIRSRISPTCFTASCAHVLVIDSE
jgi:hypothetical protein